MSKAVPKNQLPNLDKLAFTKYMKNIGRAYRKQAMELISICRTFVQAGERSISQDADLRKVFEVVDDALSSAADTKTTVGTDEKFEKAVTSLSDYEQKHHPKQQYVTDGQLEQDVPKRLSFAERMKSARENDKSSSKVLNRLKQSVKAKLTEGPTKVVRFLLPGSLTDPRPNIVEQMLGKETRSEEILWNFSRLKDNRRITLKQNPRFYEGLPRSACEYKGDFENEPIENFWDAAEIWVLKDERSPVFLETENKKRAFGNFWVPAEAIIFKDISGRLEGECIVAKDICGTPNLWHREEQGLPTAISTSLRTSTTGPANPTDLPPIITNPVKGRVFEDWRQLLRNTLGSPNISICISTRGTRPESQDNWVLSSPTNPTPNPLAPPLSATQATPTGASPSATAVRHLTRLQIPEPSLGPPTSLSFKSARSTHSPVYLTPLTTILPPSPPTTSHRRSSVAAPPSPLKPTPSPRDPPVTVLSSFSLTVATFTSPQARPSPSIIPQGSEPPPQKATSAGAALNTFTSGSIASSPPSATLTSLTSNPARWSGISPGDSQSRNRSSVPDSAIATYKARAPNPGQQQAESEAAPLKGKKQNWFQKIRNYFWN
ncbi:hypothetical protein EI94DRAFT_1701389 [Lactarius quietus]|nr:hypothetical protein EI94DRAFT_1701389 [Lactarius quietus]